MANSSSKKIQSYRKEFQKHDGGIKSLQWASYKSAANRFQQLVSEFELAGKDVLDVGCGFGDLIPFLSYKTSNFNYTGIDLLSEFTTEAQKRYPEHRFQTLDYFANSPKEKYDVVFCCGALNGQGENPLKERKRKILILFNQAKEVLVFNMAGGTGIFNDSKRIYYADSRKILDYCLTLTPKVILKQHYHSKDFTIFMFK